MKVHCTAQCSMVLIWKGGHWGEFLYGVGGLEVETGVLRGFTLPNVLSSTRVSSAGPDLNPFHEYNYYF